MIYYGDEIGMGDNIYLGDRDGVRTPMQWSPDRNGGFSARRPAAPGAAADHGPALRLRRASTSRRRRATPHSLLNWTRRMLTIRKQFKAFGR
ncbi:MAG: alpha-amylase family glycosyl hydrolase, partial [Stutzerimonas stutzeri]